MNRRKRMFESMFFLTVILCLNMWTAGSRSVDTLHAQEKQCSSPFTKTDLLDKMVMDLFSVFKTRTPITPPTQVYGSLSADEAYRVQDALNLEIGKVLGKIAGYKVAYASRAAQQQFGMTEPAYAALFQMQRISSGTKIKTGEILALFIETEIAFTMGKRVDRPLRSVEDLKPFVRWVHAAFDIGEDRFDPNKPAPLAADMIASGAAAHRFVLGPACDPADVDANATRLKMAINGVVFTEGAATNVMGSPWNSLLWIANRLVSRRKTLEPGDAVLTGTAGSAFRAKGREMVGTYLGDCGPLGQITVTIE